MELIGRFPEFEQDVVGHRNELDVVLTHSVIGQFVVLQGLGDHDSGHIHVVLQVRDDFRHEFGWYRDRDRIGGVETEGSSQDHTFVGGSTRDHKVLLVGCYDANLGRYLDLFLQVEGLIILTGGTGFHGRGLSGGNS